MKNRLFILQFIPQRLEYLLQEDPLYKGSSIKGKYIIDLTHHFLFKLYFYKQSEINLSSTIMRERYGMHYNYYIEWMEINNIISLVSDYCVGEKCRTYKLDSSIIEEPIIRIKNTDKIIVKKHFAEPEKIPSWVSNELNSSLEIDLNSIEINMDKVNEVLSEFPKESLMYKKNYLACLYINEKNIFKIWDSYGRLHTNFTTLKKSIRTNCLTINNKSIKELDIKNSQPLFLIQLLPQNLVGLKEFKTLTYSGKLYDYFSDNYGLTRDNCKKLIYTVFFGKNHNNCHSTKIFGERFPNILDWIKKLKIKYKDYTYLSKLLQQAESKFIFALVDEIKFIYKDIKIFTVHDSIYFQEDLYEDISTIFNKKLKTLCQ